MIFQLVQFHKGQGREQVNHIISEMYVRQMITDRRQFSPMVPVPFAPGKFMSVLLR